jgi:hypothetical protein
MNPDNLQGGILREPQVSPYFNVPLIGAQNKMFFYQITQTLHRLALSK